MYDPQQDADEIRATVLLIDPDRDNRDVAATVLAHGGFTVLATDDPCKGLRIARAELPTLIVTELFERTDQGWRLPEALKRHARTRDIPIVAFSAYALPSDREAAIRSGVARFLSKPLPPLELEQVVEDLIDS